jgi:hypothetical protein
VLMDGWMDREEHSLARHTLMTRHTLCTLNPLSLQPPTPPSVSFPWQVGTRASRMALTHSRDQLREALDLAMEQGGRAVRELGLTLLAPEGTTVVEAEEVRGGEVWVCEGGMWV